MKTSDELKEEILKQLDNINNPWRLDQIRRYIRNITQEN